MPFFKKRESKASPMIAVSQLGAPNWTHRDPRTLVLEGFERNAIGYRCVRLIAESAASIRINIEPEDSPLAQIMRQPNPEMNGIGLMELFFGHLQTAGNAYLEAISIDEVPRELYALRPDRTTVLKDRHGRPYGWSYNVHGREKRIEASKWDWSPVLHMKLFNPCDDYYGYSPLAAASRAIDIHNAGGAWAKALMDNSAKPSGALVYGRDGSSLTTEQFTRLKQELQDAHSGYGNAGRPLLLEGGLDWKPMSLSPAEMDFIEARHAAAREIALAFGVPPMLMGIPGDNTYSNYREANLAFWRTTVLPLANKVYTALSSWLSPRFADKPMISLDLNSITALAGERESLWQRLGGADFVTNNEKRRLAGLPALDGQDELPVAATGVSR